MDENKGIKIGIVIPIYNVAKYLRECLDSVLNQSYGNFCALLVNDGSTDNSLKIALEYVAKDSRFALIDKDNGGQSSARNVGIKYFSGANLACGESQKVHNCHFEQSKVKSSKILGESNFFLTPPAPPLKNGRGEPFISFGLFPTYFLQTKSKQKTLDLGNSQESSSTQPMGVLGGKISISHSTPPKIDYIIFLDSDDFWESDLLEKCVEIARITRESRANPDIIWFDWNEIYEASGMIQKKSAIEDFGFSTQTHISAMQWLERAKRRKIFAFWWAWGGMIRFSYLISANLRFLEGVIFEDNLFGILLFMQCESIAILPRRLYNYRIRSGSTTNRTKSLPPFRAHLRAHFSTNSDVWDYFCVYSWCEMSLAFVDFCENFSDKNRATLCESIFLSSFLAESRDILAAKSDPLNVKTRFIALLEKRGKYSPYLKIISYITPKSLKRLRLVLFLFYFAPKIALFRIKRKILRVLRIYRGYGSALY